jgi:opacity protein-like surface antigen
MKNSSRLLLVLSALTALSFRVVAQDNRYYGAPDNRFYVAPESRWYIKGDLGGNVTGDTGLREFFGEPIAPGTKVKFDPGIRFGVAAGFRLTDWFSPEIETGFMANYIDSISGANHVNAVFSNVPLLANARFQCPRWDRVTPYFGGGVGGSFPVIDSDHIEIGDTFMHGSDATAVFAYQAFAGVRFKLNNEMGLSLEYHYFHADGAEWDAEFNDGAASDKLRFGGTETHSLSIAFDWRF